MFRDKKKVYLQLWDRHLEMFEEAALEYEEVGLLVMAMLKYQFKGLLPEEIPKQLVPFWVLLRRDADYTRNQYQICVENGKKGGRPKSRTSKEKTQANPSKPLTITQTESVSESITESISATQTDSSDVCISDEKTAFGEFGWVMLSHDEYQKLLQLMGYEELNRCITYMDEAAQSTNNHRHWKDWYLMVRRCYQKKWHSDGETALPNGANGELGQAELEAIQRVLAES